MYIYAYFRYEEVYRELVDGATYAKMLQNMHIYAQLLCVHNHIENKRY